MKAVENLFQTFRYHSITSSESFGVAGRVECPTIWITALTDFMTLAAGVFRCLLVQFLFHIKLWHTSTVNEVHHGLASRTMTNDYHALRTRKPFGQFGQPMLDSSMGQEKADVLNIVVPQVSYNIPAKVILRFRPLSCGLIKEVTK